MTTTGTQTTTPPAAAPLQVRRTGALSRATRLSLREDFDRLAEEIRWHDAQATAGLATALQHYAEVGARLERAKEGLTHGHWLAWVEREFRWSDRHARRLMEWSRLVAANRTRVSDLPAGTGLLAAVRLFKDADEASELPAPAGSDAPPHVAYNSGESEWYTPAPVVAAARAVMGGIDVDPASTAVANAVVRATTYYDAAADGLMHRWPGRVWLNPPYQHPLLVQFCRELLLNLSEGHTTEACLLVNNATETEWFQRLLGRAAAVCYPKGRIRFCTAGGEPALTPLQGQAVLYFGPAPERFAEHFRALGRVLYAEGPPHTSQPVTVLKAHDPQGGGVVWVAVSRSTPGAAYVLRPQADGRLVCGCPAFGHRGTCRHVDAVPKEEVPC